jgi:hypothetical protein
VKRRGTDTLGMSPAELTAAFAVSTAIIMGIAQTSSMTAKMAKKSEGSDTFSNVLRVTRLQMEGTQCLSALQTFAGNGTPTTVTITDGAAEGGIDLPVLGVRAGTTFVPLLRTSTSIQGLQAIRIRLKRGASARPALPTTEQLTMEVSAVQDFETVQAGVRLVSSVPSLFSGVYLGNATDDAISLEVQEDAAGRVTGCQLVGGATSGMSCEDLDASARTVSTLPAGHTGHGHKSCVVSSLNLNPSNTTTSGALHFGSLATSPFTVTAAPSDQKLQLQGANKNLIFAASDGVSASSWQMDSEYYARDAYTQSGGLVKLNPSGSGRSNFNGGITTQRSAQYWNELQIENVFRTTDLWISSGFTGSNSTPSVGDGSLYVKGNVTAASFRVDGKSTMNKLLIRSGASLVVGGNMSVANDIEVTGLLTAKDIQPLGTSYLTGDITLKPGAIYEANQLLAANKSQPITIYNPLKINFQANTGDPNTIFDCKSMNAANVDELACDFASGYTNVVAGGVECNTGESIRRSKPTERGQPKTNPKQYQAQGWYATCSSTAPKMIYAICCKR